jgi:nitrogen regulatory protein PII
MDYLVLLVLHDLSKLEAILTAWEEVGVGGATVIETTGMGRIRERLALRDDMPLIPSLDDLLRTEHEELQNRTVFSIVEGDQAADRLISASEAVLGDMYKPHTGIIAVLPLARVHGLNWNWKNGGSNENPGS